MKILFEKGYPLVKGDTLRVLNNGFLQFSYTHEGPDKKITFKVEVEDDSVDSVQPVET